MKDNKVSVKKSGIRIGIIMLSLILTVTMMPVFAFAQTVTDQDVQAIVRDDNVDQADQFSEIIESPETDQDNEDDAEETYDPADDEITGLESVETDTDLPEETEMLKGYFDSQITSGTNSTKSDTQAETPRLRSKAAFTSRRDTLNALDRSAYDQIKPYIVKIASGGMSKATFSISQVDGTDYVKAVAALMADMPYEFYWYDKVEGYLHGKNLSTGKHVFYFAVSKDYWDTSVRYAKYDLVYGVNTTKTSATKNAVDRVTYIVNEFADNTDIEKLWIYCNLICALTTYDKQAEKTASNYSSGISLDPFYGDPWQLIYVFDGDESTNVVCEGYSKAFQYLCDKTDFTDSSIKCYSVAGDLYSGNANLGGHMWNIIHMGNGGNYLADITNSDLGECTEEGNYASDDVFMSGYIDGNVLAGYRFLKIFSGDKYGVYSYVYDDGTRALFKEEELTLSDTGYSTDEPKITHIPSKAADCTKAGNVECWCRLGFYYSDETCAPENRLNYSETVVKALGHVWTGKKILKAVTCTKAGSEQYTCSRCGLKETRTVSAPGHKWKTKKYLDKTKYTCKVCGKKKTVSKVIVDRPAVTIIKPIKAKKSFKVKWKKLSSKKRKKVTGIEIQYGTKKNFSSSYKIKKAKKTAVSKKITKLKSKKTYYVRIRTYKVINGKKHVSKWSKVKKIKTR